MERESRTVVAKGYYHLVAMRLNYSQGSAETLTKARKTEIEQTEDNGHERILRIRVAGGRAQSGRVPFSVLASVFASAQSAVNHIALSKDFSSSASRGSWDKDIRDACELTYFSARRSGLTFASEIARPSLPGMERVGVQALADLHQVVAILTSDKVSGLDAIMPNRIARTRALTSLQSLCPHADKEMTISLGNGIGDYYGHLTHATREKISAVIKAEPAYPIGNPQTVSGELVETRINANDRHINLRVGKHEVKCLFNADLEARVSQLVVGSLVEVTGNVILNPDASVRQVAEMSDVTTISLKPFTLRSFEWDGHRYLLRRPVQCQMSFSGGWVYECPRYRLHAFAADRADAFSQFHEEFAFLYGGLIDEPDEALTQDALLLRNRLKSDILSVS